jgi:hypothetical protein
MSIGLPRNQKKSNHSGGMLPLQRLNRRAGATVTPYVDGNGVLQVQGSQANDKIVLEPNPLNSSQTEVVDNGSVLGNFANTSFSQITSSSSPATPSRWPTPAAAAGWASSPPR